MERPDIESIRKIADAAISGPWKFKDGGGHTLPSIIGSASVPSCGVARDYRSNFRLGIGGLSYSNEVCRIPSDPVIPEIMNTVKFIVLSRTIIPELCSYAQKLEETCAETKKRMLQKTSGGFVDIPEIDSKCVSRSYTIPRHRRVVLSKRGVFYQIDAGIKRGRLSIARGWWAQFKEDHYSKGSF